MAYANPKPIVYKFTTTGANEDLLKKGGELYNRISNLVYNFDNVGCYGTMEISLPTESEAKVSFDGEFWNDLLLGKIFIINTPTKLQSIFIDVPTSGYIMLDLH